MRGGGTGLIGRRLTCEWIVGKKGETENSKQQKQNKNVTKQFRAVVLNIKGDP